MKKKTREYVYLCDPSKNIECKKTVCFQDPVIPNYGVCKFTRNPDYSLDGKRYAYNVYIDEIEEVDDESDR